MFRFLRGRKGRNRQRGQRNPIQQQHPRNDFKLYYYAMTAPSLSPCKEAWLPTRDVDKTAACTPREAQNEEVQKEEEGKSIETNYTRELVFHIGLQVQLYFRRGLQHDKTRTKSSSTHSFFRKINPSLRILLIIIVAIFFMIITNWRILRLKKIHDLTNVSLIHPQGLTHTGKPPPPFRPITPDSANLPNVVHGCGSTARDVDEIQIHLIAWKRPASTERILSQLLDADYTGWGKNVSLHIHIDGRGTSWVKDICEEFEWKHGEKILDIRKRNFGLRKMWLTSLTDASKEAGDNTLMVMLEDDVRVSRHYFQGLLAMIDAYGRNRNCRDKNLMGFSLSPIKLEELQKPFTRWDASQALGERSNKDNRHLAYLSVIPSSWGAAYWSDRWQEFADFFDHRIKPPFFDHQAEAMSKETAKGNYDNLVLTPKELQIPDSRSNLWPWSWKRFLIDFMYARGLVMIYPSLPQEEGFATTLALVGAHVWSKSSRIAANPRTTTLIEDFKLPETGIFPAYGDLAVFGLHLEPTTREDLASKGADFLHSVRDNCQGDCKDLLNHWARPETFGSQNTALDASPPICVADLYMPASANAPETIRLPSKQKYLLFEPQFGGNNQILTIVEALYWASALDRKLILPPILLPRVTEFELPFEKWPETEDFIEVGGNISANAYVKHLRHNLPLPSKNKPIGFKEWMDSQGNATNIVSRVLRISRGSVYEGLERKLMQLLDPEGEAVNINLRHVFDREKGTTTFETIQHYFGGCQDEVLAFENLFHINVVGNRYTVMPDVFSLSENAKEVYIEVLSKLQDKLGTNEYTCYHVRAGDMKDLCSSKDLFKIGNYQSWKKEGYACDIKPKQVKNAILSSNTAAFVMSDSTSLLKEVESILPSLTPIATSEWIREVILSINETINKAELDLISMLIEQELCAEATTAVLSKFSSVSGRITSLRSDEGVTYWKRPRFSFF